MKLETVLGAVIAAFILFISSMVTLFTENPELTFAAIKQSTWVAVVGGTLVAFLKDFNAINIRRMISTPTGSVNSSGVVGILAIVIACLALSGCAGTRAAYKAAEGIEETAFVISEHYFALVRELNDLDDKGALSDSMRSHAQDIVRTTRGPILELGNVAQAYKAVRSADNEEALSRALNTAAIALSRLVNVVKSARGGSAGLEHIEADIERILDRYPIAA